MTPHAGSASRAIAGSASFPFTFAIITLIIICLLVEPALPAIVTPGRSGAGLVSDVRFGTPMGSKSLVLSAQENRDRELIKKRILDGLGLNTIPSRNLSDVSEEELKAAYKEYNKAVEEEEIKYRLEEVEEKDDFNEEKENGRDSSFHFFGSRVMKHTRGGRGRRSTSVDDQIVHFQISMPLTDAVRANESRVVTSSALFWKRGLELDDYTDDDNATSSFVTVQFYRLDDVPRGKRRYLRTVEENQLIETRTVLTVGSQWLETDMTATVRKWVSEGLSNTGVLIRCLECESKGVRITTGGRRKGLADSHVPRLNVRTEQMGLRRAKRSRKMRKSMRKRRRRRHADCHDATHPKGKRSKRCCRRSMQVRFADLPQFDFILSPKEFDAYYCSGRCPARYNPANEHALLQSLLNLRGRSDVPGPCCAPTKLKGLNILHMSEEGRIMTTFWRDVIVTECGCA